MLSLLSEVMAVLSSTVILDGGIFALASATGTSILGCSCSANTRLLGLMADYVAVMRTSTGSSCGDTVKLSVGWNVLLWLGEVSVRYVSNTPISIV